MQITISKSHGHVSVVLGFDDAELDRHVPLDVLVHREDSTLLMENQPAKHHEGYGAPFGISPSLREVLDWLFMEGTGELPSSGGFRSA